MKAEQTRVREPPRVVIDVGGYRKPDLALVDVLSRLRLVTSRLGAPLVILGGGEELERLLALLGLLAVLPLDPADDLEGGREPEPREQPGVEEVVDVGDPAVAELEHLDGPGRELPGAAGFVLGEGG